MSYLIDGSNLGGVAGGARGARDAQAVLQWLMPWARRRARVVLVFDGPPRPEIASRYGPVEVRFSGGEPADDLIVRLLGARGKGWTVVTEDAELGRRCRDRGAKLLPASALTEKAAVVRRKAAARDSDKPPPSADDLAYWKKVFGGE